MYAIVDDRGTQIKVEEGQELVIDYLDAAVGSELAFDRVLLVGNDQATQIGTPAVPGAKVTAEVVGVVQGPKLVVQKARRRKNMRRKNGHRQIFSKVRVKAISAG
ncbi:MAG: 50S ribosomal protein L21 [Pirellulales bacterium]|nr:50S ribosomal protein L21 [Pirellulales bacterium]